MSYSPVTSPTPATPRHPASGPPETSLSGLHICLLGYRSHPHVGGQGIYLKYLSRALVQMGHRVDIISGPPYPELDPDVRLIQLPSLDLYSAKSHVAALRWRHLRSFTDTFEWWTMLTGGFGEPYTFGRRLVRHFEQHGCPYDIIHDNQSLCYGLLELQKRGLPILSTVHHPVSRDRELALAAAPDWGHRLLARRWYSFLGMQKKVVQRLKHLHTVSENSRKDTAAAFGRPEERIRVIPNGIDTRMFAPRASIVRDPWRLISTASSDQPLKGLSVLLRALAGLRPRYPQLTLQIVGKLKSGGATERELHQLGLEGCVEFVSGVSHAQLVDLYAASGIAVVPSLYEGFGLPAGEAMACGLPLVCSDGGALPEVIGDAALKVRAGSVEELQQALVRLLEDPALRKQLGRAGREHIVQRFSWEKVAQELTRYYQTIIAAR
jgi:glycosyltransferase involved in cell wall biosynthesis